MASGGRIQGCPEGEAGQQCAPALTTAAKGPGRLQGRTEGKASSGRWKEANAGRVRPLTSPRASVQGQPRQTCLPVKPEGPSRTGACQGRLREAPCARIVRDPEGCRGVGAALAWAAPVWLAVYLMFCEFFRVTSLCSLAGKWRGNHGAWCLLSAPLLSFSGCFVLF